MAKRNEVIERDKGWKRIQREVAEARRGGVKVGVLGDAGASEEGTDLIDIAIYNEFGTRGIPARPFIRGAYDEKRRQLAKRKERLWNLILQGRIGARRALGLLGEEHQGQIQEFMTALSQPPNAPSTIAQKGSSNPLIDTGRLRGSIRWEYENA